MRRIHYSLPLIAIGLTGCAHWWPFDGSAAATPPEPIADNWAGGNIRMERLGCAAGCPIYTVTITADGRVDYQGLGHVAVSGRRRGHADPAALARLHALCQSMRFDMLAGDYLPGSHACGGWSSDGQLVQLDIQAPAGPRRIRHFLGCHATPRLLVRMEQLIDTAARDHAWVHGNPPRAAPAR